jgi:hypothetical protein
VSLKILKVMFADFEQRKSGVKFRWTESDECVSVCLFLACTTPHRKLGYCVSLYDCKSILALLQSRVINQLERQFILDSQCEGGSGRSPHVCCFNSEPKQVTTTKSPPKNVNFLLPDPAKYDCGTTFGIRIFGGDDSDIGESPWHALLEYQNSEYQFIVLVLRLF